MSDDHKFENLKNKLLEGFYQIFPELASFIGHHDPYDNQLSKGDLSANYDLEKLFEDFVHRMKGTIDFTSLSAEHQIEWEYLEKTLALYKFKIHEQRQDELDPDAFRLLGQTFFLMIASDYAPLEKRMEAVVNRMKQVPRYLKEFRTRFQSTRPVKLWTEMAIETAHQMPGLFQLFSFMGKGQISDELQVKLEKTAAALEKPLKEHLAWLQQLQSNTTENWAIGKERLDQLLKLRGIEMTSEDILKFGRQSLKSLKDEQLQIAAQIDSNKTVDEVMAIIKENRPDNFDEILLATRKAFEEAKQFIIDNDIATVYTEDKLIVKETPVYLAQVFPVAAALPADRTDERLVGLYLVTPPKDMTNSSKVFWDYATIRNTAIHEAFPGHFLMGSAAMRGSMIYLLGWIFDLGTETTEGWAFFCEEMMMEKGFVSGAEAKIVQLTAAIIRAVRIIIDVQLSRGEMTLDEAAKMLVEETGLSKDIARAEVRRYTLLPGNPLSYLLGKYLIFQLRDEIRDKMGEQYSDKFFHDTIAAFGFVPLSMIRKVFNHRISKLVS